ncbi:hypothetical protein [Rhodanobacter sp. C06]|uniref:hypothetical protein n=1 Tax=Rhodanobacter sp. C06 TaxID=1945854 RepID=UPI0011159E2D|nr:hypothetical protein [Rhodanobacter sp. C06]
MDTTICWDGIYRIGSTIPAGSTAYMRQCGTENDLRDDGFRNCGAATSNAASQSRRSAIAADVAVCRAVTDRATSDCRHDHDRSGSGFLKRVGILKASTRNAAPASRDAAEGQRQAAA